jgi:hypothetical protein
MAAPTVRHLDFIYKEFWGARDRIRESEYIDIVCHPSKNDFDPYNLSEPYPDGLRTLELKGIPFFPFIRPSTTILLCDEYIHMYKQAVYEYDSHFHQEEGTGVVITGQEGIGET